MVPFNNTRYGAATEVLSSGHKQKAEPCDGPPAKKRLCDFEDLCDPDYAVTTRNEMSNYVSITVLKNKD